MTRRPTNAAPAFNVDGQEQPQAAVTLEPDPALLAGEGEAPDTTARFIVR